MNFDFQISESKLIEVLHFNIESQLLTQDLGIAGIREIPFNLLSGSGIEEAELGVINHITLANITLSRSSELGTITIQSPPRTIDAIDTVLTRTLSVAPILIQAFINLHCVRLSDLLHAGGDPVLGYQLVIFQARIDFVLTSPVIIGSSLSLQILINRIRIGLPGYFPEPHELPANPKERAAFENLLNMLNTPESLSRFGSIPPIVINFDGISTQLGTDFRLWNAGINFNPGVLTIRLQFDRIDLVDSREETTSETWFSNWGSFYFSPIVSRLDSADWTLFFPDLFFQRRVETTIVEALAGNTRFVLNADNMPHSSWSVVGGMSSGASPCVPGGQAEIFTRFSASARGACIPFGLDIDVNCSIRLRFSLPRSGTIRADMHLDYAPDVGDAALCSITNSLIASAAGFVIGGTFGGYPVAAIGAAVFGIAGGVGTLGAIYSVRPESFESDTLRPIEGSDVDYYTELEIPIPSHPLFGIFRATSLNACRDGLAVTGSLTPPTSRFSLLASLRQDDDFRLEVIGNECPALPLTPQIVAFSELVWGPVTSVSTIPTLYYQPIAIQESIPEGYTSVSLAIHLSGYGRNRIHLQIDESSVRRLRDQAIEERIENPGFRLLIQTNRGARLIFVRGIDATLSDVAFTDLREITQTRCELRREAAERVREFARELPIFFEPPFPIDEPDIPDVREWILNASGIRSEELLRIGRNLSGNNQNLDFIPIAEFLPNENGIITLRFWEELNPNLETLAVDIKSGVNIPSNFDTKLFVGCKHYQSIANIPLYGDYRDHAFVRIGNKTQLACATSLGVCVYGISNPMSPYLVVIFPVNGILTVRPSKLGFLIFGGTGAWWIDEKGAIHKIFTGVVLNVLEHRNVFIIVTHKGVYVVKSSVSNQKPLLISKTQGREVKIIGDTLVVDLGNQVEGFDISQPLTPRKKIVTPDILNFIKQKKSDVVVKGLVPVTRKIGDISAVLSEKAEYIKLCQYIYFTSN